MKGDINLSSLQNNIEEFSNKELQQILMIFLTVIAKDYALWRLFNDTYKSICTFDLHERYQSDFMKGAEIIEKHLH